MQLEFVELKEGEKHGAWSSVEEDFEDLSQNVYECFIKVGRFYPLMDRLTVRASSYSPSVYGKWLCPKGRLTVLPYSE